MAVVEVQPWVRRALLIFILFFLLFGAGCSPPDFEEHPAPTISPESPTAVPTETAAEGKTIQGKFTPPDGNTLLIIGQDLEAVEGYVADMWAVTGGVTTYTCF